MGVGVGVGGGIIPPLLIGFAVIFFQIELKLGNAVAGFHRV